MQDLRSWAGLPAGLVGWYGAHELGFYLLAPSCQGQRWLIPMIHVAGLACALFGAWLSAASWRDVSDVRRFAGLVGSGAGLLFAFAILWQGIAATFFYTGCER